MKIPFHLIFTIFIFLTVFNFLANNPDVENAFSHVFNTPKYNGSFGSFGGAGAGGDW